MAVTVFTIHEVRTEHARAVRRATGTNDFRDKEWRIRGGQVMQCLSSTLTHDNFIALEYV